MTAAPQLTISPRPALGTRTYLLLTLGFLFITIYGSLVPFKYEPLSWEETFARWHEVCARPLGVNSRADFVTNVLLFIPLSFLLVGTVAADRGRGAAVVAVVFIVPLCAALSASIEFTQLWFQERVSSLNDVLAETLGAVIGSATWVVAGQRITDYARFFWTACGPDNLAVRLLPGYLFLLVLVHVMPLDLTISLHDLYHKWKEGRVVLIPFTTHYGGWVAAASKFLWTVVYFFPLGALLSLWRRPTFRSGWNVLAVGLAAAAGIQFLKLFVLTRFCDATDILTGGAAVWLGWAVAEAWRKSWSALEGRPPWWADLTRPALFLAWLLALVVASWYPFDVRTEEEVTAARLSPDVAAEHGGDWVVTYDGRVRTLDYSERPAAATLGPFIVFTDAALIRRRWSDVSPVPMADLFEGTEYHAFDEFVSKTLFFLPLGALLVPPVPAKRRWGWWRALLAGLLLSCLFEVGKLLVPGRFCSPSNVLIETNAALCGYLFWRRLLALWAEQPAATPAFARADERLRRAVGLGVFITED